MLPIPFIGILIILHNRTDLKFSSKKLSHFSQISVLFSLIIYVLLKVFTGQDSILNSFHTHTTTLHCRVFFFLGGSTSHTFRHRTTVWASVAASSQTLPMVDGGWGGLQAHSITSIGYHLVFRAGGLRARSDARSAAAESGTRRRDYSRPLWGVHLAIHIFIPIACSLCGRE